MSLKIIEPVDEAARCGCSVAGCGRAAVGRGWCSMHWQRWRRHGSPTATVATMSPHGASLAERLRLHTDMSGGALACWPWVGSRSSDGYGHIWLEGRSRGAHVLALIDATGDDQSDSMMCLHSCDNPPCVNPSHLRWGTASDNMTDMYDRDRHTKRGHKLTEAQVLDIRARQGLTLHQLADEFGVSFSLISQIRHGRIWRRLLNESGRRSA